MSMLDSIRGLVKKSRAFRKKKNKKDNAGKPRIALDKKKIKAFKKSFAGK